MKDYLEAQGFIELRSPRACIKKAFELELLVDGEKWLRGLEDRNLTSHTYDERVAMQVEGLIRDTYAPLFRKLVETLGDLVDRDV